MPLSLGICGVGHKSENASGAEFAEAGKVNDAALDRSVVHLEVACVDDDARRSVYSNGNSVGDRVVHTDEFDCHTAHLDSLSRLDNIKSA